ncbi:hypothetical protein LAUMK4_05137 [Mycobacterium persicum]|uniref:Uncharacterized protein n=1 Tax=Mycobacterium persicum TaxID=1487726 RepID=A0ABY6RQJ8_9MYCO|nr:hypothetical protein [Mycobacterium persicum]VAZ80759.1 hypothetical protein LAUMK15_05535 [Mycobacterium persicum]VBA30525.1 hypothetical protein LAUMK4_05137 [Mycobacterium persicum]
MSPLWRAVIPESSRSAAETDLTHAKASLTSSRRRKCAAAAALGSLTLASGVAGAIDKPINAHDPTVSVGRLTVRLTGHGRFKLDTCSSNNNLTNDTPTSSANDFSDDITGLVNNSVQEDATTATANLAAINIDESLQAVPIDGYGSNLLLVSNDSQPPDFPVSYSYGSEDSSSSYGDYNNDSSEDPPQFPGNLADFPADAFDHDRLIFVNGMAVSRYNFTHNMNMFLPPHEDEGPDPSENIN